MDAWQAVAENTVAAALMDGKTVLYVHQSGKAAKEEFRNVVDLLCQLGGVDSAYRYSSGWSTISTKLGGRAEFLSLRSAERGSTRGISVDLVVIEADASEVDKARPYLALSVIHKHGRVIERVIERDRG